MDIFDYYEEKKTNDVISKQAYLKQRKKLNYKVFSHLNQSYLKSFYSNLKGQDLFHGYLVMAVDGSKAEVPASDENIKQFGEHTRERGTIRTLVNCITDVFYKFTLDLQLGSIYNSESELALLNIQAAKEIIGEKPLLLLFDRGYPEIELMNRLDEAGIKYIFRLSSNDYKNERSKMIKADEIVKLQHTSARLSKIRKKHPKAATWLSTIEFTETRIVRTSTPSGMEIAFATNLFNEYKYHVHANENMAMGLFKRAIIGIMLEENLDIRQKNMMKLQKSIETYTLPYRKCSGHERVFKNTNKNKRNLKRTF